MKNKIELILCAVMVCFAFAGCKNDNNQTSDTGVTTSAAADDSSAQGEAKGTFDIETVRKNIVIKGQPFEIPMALKDLPEGWTWEESENSKWLDDGLGLVTLYYNGEKMVYGGLENYYDDNKKDGIIYNTSLETNDCSIDGIVPLKTTLQEVVDKYGEPTDIVESGLSGDMNTHHTYTYGVVKSMTSGTGRFNSQCVKIGIDKETQIVSFISITYADFDKEY